jgi:hypothetical protein
MGGGLYVAGGGVYTLGSRFRANSAVRGAGVFVGLGARLRAVKATLVGNHAELGGGGLYNQGLKYLQSCAFALNKAVSQTN